MPTSRKRARQLGIITGSPSWKWFRHRPARAHNSQTTSRAIRRRNQDVRDDFAVQPPQLRIQGRRRHHELMPAPAGPARSAVATCCRSSSDDSAAPARPRSAADVSRPARLRQRRVFLGRCRPALNRAQRRYYGARTLAPDLVHPLPVKRPRHFCADQVIDHDSAKPLSRINPQTLLAFRQPLVARHLMFALCRYRPPSVICTGRRL